MVNTCDGCTKTLYSCLDNFAINLKLFQTKRCCTEAPACDYARADQETRRRKRQAPRARLQAPGLPRLGPAQPPGLGARGSQSPPCQDPQAGTPMLQALGWPGPPLRPSGPWAGRLQLPQAHLPRAPQAGCPACILYYLRITTVSLDS